VEHSFSFLFGRPVSEQYASLDGSHPTVQLFVMIDIVAVGNKYDDDDEVVSSTVATVRLMSKTWLFLCVFFVFF